MRLRKSLVIAAVLACFSAPIWTEVAIASTWTQTTIGPTGSQPTDIAVDSNGNVFVTNFVSDTVTKFAPNGSVLASYGVGDQPLGITIDQNDNVYVANYASNNVSRIAATNGNVTALTIAGGLGPIGITSDSTGNVYTVNTVSNNVTMIPIGGLATIIGNTGNAPVDILIDAAGTIFTANLYDNSVTRFVKSGATWTPTNIAVAPDPRGLAIDSSGNVYISHELGNEIRKIAPGASTSTTFASVASPYGMKISSDGYLYVARWGSDLLVRYSLSGVQETIGATGDGPRDVAFDSSGNVFVVNQFSNNITKFSRPEPIVVATPLGVTFDTQGGSPIAKGTTINGGSVTDPGIPTRDGFTFVGWNTAANGTGTAIAFPYHHTNSSDFTLYAQWRANVSTTPTTAPPTTAVTPLIPEELPSTGGDLAPWPWLLLAAGFALITVRRHAHTR